MKRVEVLWTDAVTMHGDDWCEPAKVTNRPMPTRTCGYLVAESDDAVTVCALVNDDHVALGVTIPRAMIDKIVRLR